MLKYLSLIIKGIAMGAADVVPGVSGGTIAFMTGIYEKLISSIKSIDHIAFGLLLKGNIKLFWEKINGSFLISVFGGVMISILSLARLMEYLLVNHPIPLWSFFFGLIIASSFFILKHIEKWNLATFISLIAGIAIAVWISIVSPAQTTEALWFVFLSGMVAICAMILPGISGSFILLLMGKYAFMMTAIKDFDFVVILVFVAGAAIGIISFSHFLSWLLKRFYSFTIAILSGFMAGSLVKVWPWKTQSLRFEGLDYPTSPSNYEMLSGNDPQIVWAVIFLSSGVLLVLTIEFIAKKMRN
ncbi:MAG: DUF368 domain-containing protein [Bacteroidales bacterium]|jgi:putative membrane protein|nr:DUF368 domain-containing protein [Bacteroidales bacterium]MDD3844570.1 DUF368 domain-containing protein [Bacteroidales bacterium]MDD4618878.1 DUF368 domain-containing protein [Bacteroidales bacterium]